MPRLIWDRGTTTDALMVDVACTRTQQRRPRKDVQLICSGYGECSTFACNASDHALDSIELYPHYRAMVRRIALCVAFVIALLIGSVGAMIVGGGPAEAHPVASMAMSNSSPTHGGHLVDVKPSKPGCPPGGCDADPTSDKDCLGPTVSCGAAAISDGASQLRITTFIEPKRSFTADFALRGVSEPVDVPPPR